MGGCFFDDTPVSGWVPRGVVVGLAQNGTVGCTKVHFRRVTSQAVGQFIPKVLEAVRGDAYDARPFFRGERLDSSVGRATD